MTNIYINTPNTTARRLCEELFEDFNVVKTVYTYRYHKPVVKLYNRAPEEEKQEIIRRLEEWLGTEVERQSDGCGYHIYLTFLASERVPPLPGKNIIPKEYYKTEEGFLTNPNNWNKGLNLV